MRRARLPRGTPFRLAVSFAALTVLAFLISGLIVFAVLRGELLRRHERAIRHAFETIASSYEASDPEELVEVTRRYVAASSDQGDVVLLLDADGRKIAGNIEPMAVVEGWSDMPGARLGLNPEHGYRLLEARVPSGWLIVGSSDADVVALSETAIAGFAWASIVVISLAAAGGAALAARARRRYDAVRDTMDRIAQGRLDARIPLLGHGDDLDALAADMNAALGRLAAVVEGMRQVTSDIAHDLRTPLNRLKMRIETALDRRERGEPSVEDLQAASAECDRINETFAALLRIAQIESGARRARFRELSLRAVIEELIAVYDDVAEDAGMSLALTMAGADDAKISGDRELLTQMLVNLIENALVHCPAGSRIVCALERRDGAPVVTVSDNGPGVPGEERANVLSRFYRLEKSRTSPGSGLGLSLVRAVAELHGARLALLDNAPGLRVEVAFAGAAAAA